MVLFLFVWFSSLFDIFYLTHLFLISCDIVPMRPEDKYPKSTFKVEDYKFNDTIIKTRGAGFGAIGKVSAITPRLLTVKVGTGEFKGKTKYWIYDNCMPLAAGFEALEDIREETAQTGAPDNEDKQRD